MKLVTIKYVARFQDLYLCFIISRVGNWSGTLGTRNIKVKTGTSPRAPLTAEPQVSSESNWSFEEGLAQKKQELVELSLLYGE